MKNPSWWLILLQGLVAIAFGLAILVWPIKSLVAITWLVGVFLILESIILILGSFFNRENFAGLFILGIVFGAFGLLIRGNPEETLRVLVVLFAIWSIVSGIIQMIVAVTDKEASEAGQVSLLGGIFSLIVGIFLFAYPVATVGLSQIIFGLTILVFGFGSIFRAFKPRSA
ncbi:MAG TPA: DUF308 domain-containing protein [Candidatus Saccharimonadales bacterium]|nr:DUF308 domain-containing protein [Candidatus Saccharimonadales bacterium]